MSHGEAFVVVPARRGSTRLPEKLLLAESGQTVLAHTLRRCLAARIPAKVLAAVDDPELAEIAENCGAQALMTPSELASGTDRVWYAVRQFPDARWIVNVQADEPEIDPDAIDALFSALSGEQPVATLATPFDDPEQAQDPAAVKVVLNSAGQALYFSRARIPYERSEAAVGPKLHLGVYGFSRQALARFADWSPGPLERTEGLEQLRFLENGEPIAVVEWPRAFPGIDTRQDYEAFLQRVAANK